MMIYAILISQKMKHYSEYSEYTNAHKNKNCDINIFLFDNFIFKSHKLRFR
jgi:hypothetical protein